MTYKNDIFDNEIHKQLGKFRKAKFGKELNVSKRSSGALSSIILTFSQLI